MLNRSQHRSAVVAYWTLINREGCLVFTKEIPDELIKRTGLSVGQGDEAIVLLSIGDKDVQIGMEPAKGIRRVGAEIEINKIHNLFHLYPGTYAFQFGRAKKVVSSQKRRVFRVGAGGNLNPLPSESIEVWQVQEMPPIQRMSLTSRHAYLAGKDSSGKTQSRGRRHLYLGRLGSLDQGKTAFHDSRKEQIGRNPTLFRYPGRYSGSEAS